MTIKAGATGHPPTIKVTFSEQSKYEQLWESDDYREVSPGERSAQIFLEQANPLPNSTCIDFGCGTGRGGLMIALFGNLIVTLVDFAKNALDEDVKNATVTQPTRISWVQADLNEPLPVTASYGYCVDVMEHLPPAEIDRVLENILRSASHVFFQIDTADDIHGEAIVGKPLHLSVHPYEWWVKKFRQHDCAVHWSRDLNPEGYTTCQFYVSSWTGHNEIQYEGSVNTEIKKVRKHIRENAKTPWQTIVPHPIQDTEIMLLAGGPSLNDFTDEIIEQRAKGMPLITTNGTYNWALEHGMTPSMQLIIDARKFNKRFVTPVVDDCKYMIASQAHPEVFKDLPVDRTYIWHVTLAEEVTELLDELYEIWFPSPGGSTVTLRGLCLLRMLGFHNIHMYGFDSCYRDEKQHHAYDQPENDFRAKPLPVSVGGKVFWCDAWMHFQATEFMQMVAHMFDDQVQLDVKGDGLIAHIIKTGAALSALEEDEE